MYIIIRSSNPQLYAGETANSYNWTDDLYATQRFHYIAGILKMLELRQADPSIELIREDSI